MVITFNVVDILTEKNCYTYKQFIKTWTNLLFKTIYDRKNNG